MTEKQTNKAVEHALADLFARDIEREVAEGRPENAQALATTLGIDLELPPSDERTIVE